jgi:hypothetical protein
LLIFPDSGQSHTLAGGSPVLRSRVQLPSNHSLPDGFANFVVKAVKPGEFFFFGVSVERPVESSDVAGECCAIVPGS